jgi:hypothetical protein
MLSAWNRGAYVLRLFLSLLPIFPNSAYSGVWAYTPDYNPLTFMLGGKAFQWSTGLLSGQFPVLNALAFCVLAVLLIAISVKAIGNLDF